VKEKKGIFKKILSEQHIVVTEEHIRVFYFGLTFKKNALCAVGKGA
jgi:hypothetical protein